MVARKDGPSRQLEICGFWPGQFVPHGRQFALGLTLLGIRRRSCAVRASRLGLALLERVLLGSLFPGHGLAIVNRELDLWFWFDFGVEWRRYGRTVIIFECAFLREGRGDRWSYKAPRGCWLPLGRSRSRAHCGLCVSRCQSWKSDEILRGKTVWDEVIVFIAGNAWMFPRLFELLGAYSAWIRCACDAKPSYSGVPCCAWATNRPITPLSACRSCIHDSSLPGLACLDSSPVKCQPCHNFPITTKHRQNGRRQRRRVDKHRG